MNVGQTHTPTALPFLIDAQIDHIILDGLPPASPGSVTYAVEANDPNINYSPSGSWTNVKADGSFDSRAMFLVSDFAEGAINYTFSRVYFPQ